MRRRTAPSAASLAVIAIAATVVVGLLVTGALSSGPAPNAAAALTSVEPSSPALLSMSARASPAPSIISSHAPTPIPSATSPLPSPTLAPLPTPLTPEARNVLLQRTLNSFRRKAAIPGVSVTVEFADGTSWTGVSGIADIATNSPVTPTTTFAVGSISKTFLATLVLELAAEQKLRLDDRIARYLPELGLDRRITIRELLDHTSGLYDYFLNPKIDPALQRAPTRLWTATQALAYMRTRYFPPGKGWHYSNANYLILGLLAEKVGGASLARQLRSRFFEPLDLAHTWYQIAEKPRQPLAHGYRFAGTSRTSRPIDLSDGTGVAPFTSVVSAAAGAGSIASTSADLAHWAKALYGGKVLAPTSFGLMVGDVTRTARYRPRIPYGLGVQAVSVNGLPTLGHSGRLLGFRSLMRYFPGQNVSIAIVTNQSRADPAPLLARLARIAIGAAPGAL
jgi:D-alanyl-D-alanine carboxypeptidase